MRARKPSLGEVRGAGCWAEDVEHSDYPVCVWCLLRCLSQARASPRQTVLPQSLVVATNEAGLALKSSVKEGGDALNALPQSVPI